VQGEGEEAEEQKRDVRGIGGVCAATATKRFTETAEANIDGEGPFAHSCTKPSG